MGAAISATPEQSVFVYGKFRAPGNALLGVPPQEEPAAIEVLREFSPYEFIGKILVRRETEWRVLTPENASARDWYRQFQGGLPLSFEMQGSGSWEIAWFRFETSSRNPNPYVAVALRRGTPETGSAARSAG